MPCTSTTKPPSTSKFYVDFKKLFFKDQKIETHLFIFKGFAPCQVDLWAETLRFSAVLPLENTQTSSVASFFHTHMLPHHSKAQHRGYCGKRSFLGVAKSWKVNLDRVPWMGAILKIWLTSSYIQLWLWPGLTKVSNPLLPPILCGWSVNFCWGRGMNDLVWIRFFFPKLWS